MNLLIFSDKDPIGFQSRRQLGWLFEFIKDNHHEINVKMLDSFDDSKTNYDAVLIHGYDAKTIKHLRKTHPSSKLLLLNPGLLTTYHEISLISKQKIKAILQKNIIEKNIDATKPYVVFLFYQLFNLRKWFLTQTILSNAFFAIVSLVCPQRWLPST